MDNETIKITVFESGTRTKIPTSPYDDKTFTFNTIDVPVEEIKFLIENFYYLNRGFNIKNKRLIRSKGNLEKYLLEEIQFIPLDIDKVYSIASRDSIVQKLKEYEIPMIIMESRGYNGETNFNMKGMFFVQGYNNTNGILEFLHKIQRKIGNLAEIDLSVSRIGALQAPTLNSNVIYEKYDGKKPYIRYIEEKEYDSINMDNEILTLAINHLFVLGFRIAEEKDELIIFQHPEEKTPKGYFLFKDYPFELKHFNPSKNISLFKELIKHKIVKKYFEELDEEKRKEILNCSYDGNKKVINEKFLSVNGKKIFIKSFLNDENGVLHIKSPMGTGKSNLINYILENTSKRVLFITNRISIAKDIHEKYNDLKFYSDLDWKTGDNLVCQFDSLWKYNLEDFDIVIIDEFMSLLLHTRNSLNSYNVLNKIKFFFSLNKQLVILDAFLFNYEKTLLQNRNSYIIENEWRDKSKLTEFKDINKLLSELINVCERTDKKVTVSCNTKSMANSIKLMLEKRGKKTIIIDSGTSEEEKGLIYSTFKEENENYDVLIYSPSLTVGISIEFDSDWHFHIDEGNSIDVISSLQMMRRNRKAKNICFFVKEKKKYLQYDAEILLSEFRKDIESKFFNNKDTGFLIDVDENGNFKPSKFAEFQMKIEALFNLLMNNNYMSFRELLKYQFFNDPIINSKHSESFISKYKKEYKDNEKRVMEILSSKFEKGLDNDKRIERIKKEFIDLKPEEMKWILNESIKTSDIIRRIYNYKIYNENKIKNIISKLANENILSVAEKQNFRFMLLLYERNFVLKQRYTLKELKEFAFPIDKLKTFLYSVGYKWKYNSFILEPEIDKLSKKMLL